MPKESPGEDKEASWLPAPAGEFLLYLRAYEPKTRVVDRSWSLPAIVRDRT
ncbi:DUF1214 domain-containing protein [Agrobacterium pusense]|uniref:DUF1214 domain-containing protein n=1 Tax=Agrobacterium pusense TaxID=648995 RepID=UPI001CB7A077|nr:DUF1214 domain-containing protein [Agrobacterium pusense]